MCSEKYPYTDRPQSQLAFDINEEFEEDRVIVDLQWTQQSSLSSYSVSIVPWTPVTFNNTGAKLLGMLYNIRYNVSIVEYCQDEQSSELATVIQLHYGECID